MTEITCTVRVTAADRHVARVSVRRQQFSIGRPVEFDEASPDIAALECALGAVGAELVNGLRVFADRRRLAIDAIEAVVDAELEHGLAYLEVIGEPGATKVRRIHVKVFVAAEDESAIRRLWNDELLDRLPLVGTWRAATSVDLELVFTL